MILFKGNKRYLSQELLQAHEKKVEYKRKIDISSFGVNLYNFAFRYYPFGLNIKNDIADTILEQLYNVQLEFPFYFEISECFKNFLTKIFVKYDIKKYDAKDLLNNYLVKEDIINEEKNTEIIENFITIFINNNMTKFI